MGVASRTATVSVAVGAPPARKKSKNSLDIHPTTWYNTRMKKRNSHLTMKNIIIIALVFCFNDFVGSILREIGILIARVGNLLQTLPEIF